MILIERLCLNCMTDKGNNERCRHCGFDERNPASHSIALPFRTLLNDRFVVGRILGQPGGFGITYLAWDSVLESAVAIKEYMPLASVSRIPGTTAVKANSEHDQVQFSKGLSIFLNEAKTLAQFSHPNIARIRDFFKANNTAYLVMDYHRGVPLDEYIAQHGGRLKEEQALAVMLPILDGLKAIHQCKFLHRDIKPRNIYITGAGIPILLDFGAARLALGDSTNSLTVMLSRGFAPFEQYHEKGAQGPWSDIYACGATLYYLVTGVAPPDAIERRHNDQLLAPKRLNPALSDTFNDAIIKALSINPNDRPKNVEQFHLSLTGKLQSNQASNTISLQPTLIVPGLDQPRTGTRPANFSRTRRVPGKSLDLPSQPATLGKFVLVGGLGIALLFGWLDREQPPPSPGIIAPVAEITAPSAVVSEPDDAENFATSEPALVPEPEIPEPDTIDFATASSPAEANETQKVITTQQPTPTAPEPQQTGQKPHNSSSSAPPTIPPHAYEACAQKTRNTGCSFPKPDGLEEGRCLPVSAKMLACIPNFAPDPPAFD